MSDVERQVRETLQEMADHVRVPPVAPPAMLRRAARRRAATVILATGAVAVLAVGIVLGRNLLPKDLATPRPRLPAQVGPRVISTLRLSTHPAQIAVGHGAVWVVNEDDGSRSRIDPATGAVSEDAAHEVSGLTVAGDEVVTYGSEFHSSVVLRLAPDGSGRTLGRVPLPDGAEYDVGRVATSPGAIWVARWTHDGSLPGQLFHIDPTSNTVLKTIRLASPKPGGLAVGNGAVWVTSNEGGTLLRVSLASGAVSPPMRIGGD
ncbi:MAG TPA: hypothetical protein VKA30_05955, partial [Actinomycetota bacterium]|nr:hypothetical protein [Actinomycetota bacterium]